MNRGPSLFDHQQRRSFGTATKQLVRRTDPVTSIEAACSIDTTELEGRVYRVIESFGSKGCIANDVEARLPNHASHTITPRFRPLLDKGLIEETGEKRLGRYGRQQRVVRVYTGATPPAKKDKKKTINVMPINRAIDVLERGGSIAVAIKLLKEAIAK